MSLFFIFFFIHGIIWYRSPTAYNLIVLNKTQTPFLQTTNFRPHSNNITSQHKIKYNIDFIENQINSIQNCVSYEDMN